jgi:hypothetical protein
MRTRILATTAIIALLLPSVTLAMRGEGRTEAKRRGRLQTDIALWLNEHLRSMGYHPGYAVTGRRVSIEKIQVQGSNVEIRYKATPKIAEKVGQRTVKYPGPAAHGTIKITADALRSAAPPQKPDRALIKVTAAALDLAFKTNYRRSKTRMDASTTGDVESATVRFLARPIIDVQGQEAAIGGHRGTLTIKNLFEGD